MNKPSLRIGVDSRELQYGMGGIARFLSNMLRALSETGHEIILFANHPDGLKYLGLQIVIIPSCNIPLVEDQINLYRAARNARIDLFVSPYYKVPLLLNCRCIITIYDFTVLIHPVLPFVFRLYFRVVSRICSAKADMIFTVSECSKGDILKYTRVGKEKVKIVYPIIPDGFKPTYNFDHNKYDIAHTYVLYVGNLCPHKNLKTLLRAYANLKDNLRERHQLVIVGKTKGMIGRIDQNVQYLELIEISRHLGIKDNIRFIEFVDDEDLPGLYTHARALILPSYYEGFGLPVIEAMACGCPVIVSDRSSLPEIAGDAGIFFEPANSKELSDKMALILTEEALRKDLVKKGLTRAEYFRHDRIKHLIIEAIESIKFKEKKDKKTDQRSPNNLRE